MFTSVSMRSLPPCRFLLCDLLLERSDLLLWVWNKGNNYSGRLVRSGRQHKQVLLSQSELGCMTI